MILYAVALSPYDHMTFAVGWTLNTNTSDYMAAGLVPGPIAQLVASQIDDPGVVSFIPAQLHTFLEIDHEKVSMVISSFS